MVQSRKDFIRQAKILATVRSNSIRNRLIKENAKAFRASNPRFSEARFKEFIEKERRNK